MIEALLDQEEATEDGLDKGESTGDGRDPEFKPFDPNKIRVRQVPMPVFTVCERLKHDEIDLAPEFQRRAGLWSDAAKSRLIESLLIRIPLPAFYLEEVEPDKYAAVDGVQRLTVLKRFIVDKTLRLSGLEFLELNGKGFDDLPSTLQRRINETSLTIYIIEPGTPSAAKLNIFKRINTGGVSLTAQEIRHAMNPGPVRNLLQGLGASDAFKKATMNGVDDRRMADREMVARFFAFRDDGRTRYQRSRDLDGFINDQMVNLNQVTDAERERLGARFVRAMEASYDTLGHWAFRRPGAENRRSPVNKALFEAWAVALDEVDDATLVVLKDRSSELVAAYKSLLTNDKDLVQAVTGGTGNVSKVTRRFDAMRDLVIEVAK